MHKEGIDESALERALNLLEKGKTIPEILDLFPEHREELAQIFSSIEALSNEKKRTLPAPALTTRILDSLELAHPTAGILGQGQKSRISLQHVISYWKIALPGAIAVLVGVVFITNQLSSPASITPIEQIPASSFAPTEPLQKEIAQEISPKNPPRDTQTLAAASDALSLEAIQYEEQQMAQELDIQEFFAAESSVSAIDATLASF